jgi:uncharacterized protein DUF4157
VGSELRAEWRDRDRKPPAHRPRAPTSRLAPTTPGGAALGSRPSLTPANVLALQRSAGNAAVQRALAARADDGAASAAPAAPAAPAATAGPRHGLPARLRAAVEALSGVPLRDVRVHYDSAKPAALGALAYARGTDVHLGPGQERHLPHEAWHVVQQRQGRARADAHFMGRPIATDPALEQEADVMGDAATRLAADPRTEASATAPDDGAAATSTPVDHADAPAVLQAKWRDAGRIDPWNLVRLDREGALLELARAMGSPLLRQYEGLAGLFEGGGAGLGEPVRDFVREFVRSTLADGASHATDDLLSHVIREVTGFARPRLQAVGGGDDDENDHPEEDSPAVEENLITDPTHVNPGELRSTPWLLEIIFRNIANAMGYPDVTEAAFREWFAAGVVTRWKFREILERHRAPVPTGATNNVMQLKRRPNTVSGPSSYVSSNFGQFTNVTYTTDASANIDFSATTGHTTWSNPVMPGTVVRLQTGATRPGYGVLNNGVETKLFKAGRSRHNMIANRLRPDLVAAATASYTWHHNTQEYEMVLVDYMTHRKHGHNGGFLFWRDGQ